MAAATPFALLQDIDQRCRDNARGLPTGNKVVDDWVGIGFKLLGKRLIAPMSEVAEILPPPGCIRVPRVLNWVVGLANVRGNLMPVLDMSQFLQSKPIDRKQDSRVLIVDRDGVVAALLVEEVFGLRRFKPDMRQQAGSSDMGLLEPFLDGAFTDNQEQWQVFSMDKLIHDDSFLKIV